MAAATGSIRALAEMDLEALARSAAASLPPGGLSKFQPCLPPAMETELVMRRVYDPPGARRLLTQQARPILRR